MKSALLLRIFLPLVGLILLGVGLVVYRISLGTALLTLLTFTAVLVLFNLMIVVHELGHFLAARWCKLKVEKFAIWFGKPLWAKKIDGVEYSLGTIPFGGFVAIPQMAPMETLEGKSETPREELPVARPGAKIIVALAGPLFSFLLALVLAVAVWIVGKPISDLEKTTKIGYALPGGPADRAGLRPGDVIESINGYPVHRWNGVPDGVIWRIISNTAETIDLVVQRQGVPLHFKVKPSIDPRNAPKWYQRAEPPRLQIGPAIEKIVVDRVYPNSPAQLAGIQPGDRLLAFRGQPIYDVNPIEAAVKAHPFAPVELTLARGDKTWMQAIVPVRPVSPKNLPPEGPQTDLGLEYRSDSTVVMDHPTPWAQIEQSASMVRNTLGLLVTPNSNVGVSQLSGPIGIMNLFGRVLSSPDGWRLVLALAVIINVNLAIMNLFPIPVLDGGHILLSIIEWVQSRPLSLKILEPVQTACALVLFSFILYVTFFDAQDTLSMARGLSEDTQLRFAPPAKP